MYSEIKLSDPQGNERTVPMLANAATPIRFKNLFHADILNSILQDGEFDIDIVSKLAFVMAKQAAKQDFSTINFDKYVEWLEDFDSMTFIEKSAEIFTTYINSRENKSIPKK